MSAILGLFAPVAQQAPSSVGDVIPARMLDRMSARGAARSSQWSDGGAVLAVGRHSWELASGYSGPVLVVHDGELAVAADASLYYRDDLRRALAGRNVRPSGQTPSHLILAAYRAWGVRLAEHLEGDYAFVLYDRRARRVVAARDFTGSRPLFHATLDDGTLLVASTISAIEAHPAYRAALDLAELAVDAAGLLLSVTDATCHTGVRRVGVGRTLVREGAGRVQEFTHWEPPRAPSGRATPFAEGAAELRELLVAATHERLAPNAPSTVWMSGGHDSTAIFGAGRHALERHDDPRALLPVSLRLRDDDPGCETHFIDAVARRWDAPVHWIDAATVPLVAPDRARTRDEPWSLEYGGLSHALCAGSQALDAQVAMVGHGGDLLFAGSMHSLTADLLRTGRLLALWREWRQRMHGDVGMLVRHAVVPLVPTPLLEAAGRARGRRITGLFERSVPRWLRPEFVRAHGIDRRAREAAARPAGGSRSGYEMYWLLTRSHMARACVEHHEFALGYGIESRWPLMDPRVIAFAANRPMEERLRLGERKRLLRAAMQGLLPDEVIAHRPVKTGTMADYFSRAYAAVVPMLQEVARAPRLADLGIVDADKLRRAVQIHVNGNSDLNTDVTLLSTLQCELWLRARERATHEPDVPVGLSIEPRHAALAGA